MPGLDPEATAWILLAGLEGLLLLSKPLTTRASCGMPANELVRMVFDTEHL